jgi:polar amino acid transport system permease protein
MQGIISFLTGILTLGGGIDWQDVRQYFFNDLITRGVWITIILSVIAQIIGTLLGFVLYLLRQSKVVPLQVIGEFYVWLFRGTPLLLQILILYESFPLLHLTQTLQQVTIFQDLGFAQVPFESFLIVLIAFSLNEGAYMAEIVRSGIDSIDVGQMEAAKSLGMNYALAMRRIIVPQAARVILPPLGNEFNNMLKTTSLASVASLYELLNSARQIGAQHFNTLDMLVVAGFWYLIMTTIWGFAQSALERRFNASSNVNKPTMRSRLSRILSFGNEPVSVSTTSH